MTEHELTNDDLANAEVTGIVMAIAELSSKQREDLFSYLASAYCIHCGGDPRCQCWNDE